MRKLRKCTSNVPYTGISKCQPDFGKVKLILLVRPGNKLPEDLDATKLEAMCHAPVAERAYGIKTVVEYAKDGGEVETSDNGYGGEQVTGVSAMKETFTLDRYYPAVSASLLRCAGQSFDAYYIDENYNVYGINDDTDALAGYPMSGVYPNSTPHPTSSALATMEVTCSHEDAKKSLTQSDFIELGFNPFKLTLGLTEVKFEKGDDGYKLYEKVGGADVTAIYAPQIVEAGTKVLDGTTTAATYDAAKDVIIIAGTDTVRLKSADVLYTNGIKGIEQVE